MFLQIIDTDMNNYTFTISGMTCHACESLITMDLEDAGLPAPASIDAETGKMTIALADETAAEAVKKAVSAGDKYVVESVERV